MVGETQNGRVQNVNGMLKHFTTKYDIMTIRTFVNGYARFMVTDFLINQVIELTSTTRIYIEMLREKTMIIKLQL